METRVYRHRSPAFLAGSLFLGAWGALFATSGLIAASKSARVMTESARPASENEARFLMIFAIVAGFLVLVTGAALFNHWLFSRVEVDANEVRQFNFRNSCRVRAGLEELAAASLSYGRAAIKWGTKSALAVQLEPRSLRFSGLIDNYGDLRQRLETACDRPDPIDTLLFEIPLSPASEFQPTHRSYTYAWSWPHVFSFLWLGGIGYFAGGFVDTRVAASGLASLSITDIVLASGIAAFALIGIWLQLKGWFERVTLGPDELVWQDCLGRSRVRCKLEEITGREVDDDGAAASMCIFTLRGTVPVSGMMNGFRHLQSQIDDLIEGRPVPLSAVEQPVSPS